MKEQIEKAIKDLAKKAGNESSSISAQQYSQAVSNLSNSLVAIKEVEG